MMNGKFLAERTDLTKNTSLRTIATSPITNERRIETLYVLVLSRLPRAEESARLVRYIENGGPTRNPQQSRRRRVLGVAQQRRVRADPLIGNAERAGSVSDG